jgi:dethiobiotin synthetase
MAIYLGITGTGTGIGKTALSAALVLWARSRGLVTGYCKPVQCGLSRLPGQAQLGGDAELIQHQIQHLPSQMGPLPVHTLVSLKMAASPHLAANSEGKTLKAQTLSQAIQSAAHRVDLLIIEGAGGAAVPFHSQGWSVVELALPITWVVAASPELGTLHHTRSTIEFMLARKAKVAGFVFCHQANDSSDLVENNRETLESLVDLPCLAQLPFAQSWNAPTGLKPKDAQDWIQAIAPKMDKWLHKQSTLIR